MIQKFGIKEFSIAVGFILFFSVLESRPLLTIGGITPYFVFVLLITLLFYVKSFNIYFLLVTCGSIAVRQSPDFFDPLAWATASLCIVFFWLKNYIALPERLSLTVMIVGGMTSMHIMLNSHFITAATGYFFLDIVVSLLSGLLMYEALSFVYKVSSE